MLRKNGIKQGLKGNTTLFAFERAGVLNEWANLTDKVQELVIEFLANITTFSDIEDNTDEYIGQSFVELTRNISADASERQRGIDFICALKKKQVFLSFTLEKGRASYSVKALRLLTDGILQGQDETDLLARIQPVISGNS